MKNNLRKVKFIVQIFGFEPDMSNVELEKIKDCTKEKIGYFHRWIDDIDTSKDIPYIKTMALVENEKDGKLYAVEFSNIRFLEE